MVLFFLIFHLFNLFFLRCLSVNINENATKMSSEIRVRTSGTWDPSGSSSSSNWLEVLRRRLENHLYNAAIYSVCTVLIYILYMHCIILDTKQRAGTRKWYGVYCSLVEGDHFLRFRGRLVFRSVAWRENLPTLKARTMNAPAVFEVIHDYGLLLRFMSTSDETCNVFQVTMRCLEDVSGFIWLQGYIAGDNFFLSDSQHFESALSQAEASSLWCIGKGYLPSHSDVWVWMKTLPKPRVHQVLVNFSYKKM